MIRTFLSTLLLLPSLFAYLLKPATVYRNTITTTRFMESGRNLNIPVEGGEIFFDFYKSKDPHSPSIVYLPCLNRPKNEAKSTNLQAWCRRRDISFLCADYFGVGRSSGAFFLHFPLFLFV